MTKLTQHQQDQIIKLKQEGYGSRFIASYIGSCKSTVNNFYSKWKDAEGWEPKIIFIDLETSASIAATFGRWNQNIPHKNILHEGGWIISAAWKWLGEDKVYSSVVSTEDALECRDIQPVAELYEAIEKSDVIVAHNLLGFDLPVFRTRLLLNGMDMHKTVQQIDTLKIAKKLRFNSNKLGSLADYLGIEQKKHEMNIRDWIDCLNGDSFALQKMNKYNKQDVLVLEQVYLKLRGFSLGSGNVNRLYNDNKVRCSACGSTNMTTTGNTVYTGVSSYEEYLCSDCGSRSRTRKNLTTKDQRDKIVIGCN